jgi:hypothetical protein
MDSFVAKGKLSQRAFCALPKLKSIRFLPNAGKLHCTSLPPSASVSTVTGFSGYVVYEDFEVGCLRVYYFARE